MIRDGQGASGAAWTCDHIQPSSTADQTARAISIRSANGASPRRPRPTCTRSRGAIAGGSGTPASKLAPKGRPLPGTFASGWKHRMDRSWERRAPCEVAALAVANEQASPRERSPTQPIQTRIRAAMAALPFEYPKLAAVISASLSGGEFGEALERARKRMDGPQTLLLKAPAQPTDLSGPPMVSDRRFRN
jgi:hypothetical protein